MVCLRQLPGSLAVIAALMLSGPTVALASSAGDQQYTDPLAPGHSGSSQSSSGSSQSSSTSSGTSAPSSSSTAGGAAASATPSSTSSSGTTSSTTGANSTLPRTGYNSDLSAALGLGLVLSGFALRRSARSRRGSGA